MTATTDPAFTRTNGGTAPITFWFEPVADEIQLPPSATIEVYLGGAPAGTLEIDDRDDWVTVWSPSGAFLKISIDGVSVDCGSTSIQVPDFEGLSPKSFVKLVFGEFPEARPGGIPIPPHQTVWSKIKRRMRGG